MNREMLCENFWQTKTMNQGCSINILLKAFYRDTSRKGLTSIYIANSDLHTLKCSKFNTEKENAVRISKNKAKL